MTDDLARARRILDNPLGLMLPNNLGRALIARIDALEADRARIRAEVLAEVLALPRYSFRMRFEQMEIDEYGQWLDEDDIRALTAPNPPAAPAKATP